MKPIEIASVGELLVEIMRPGTGVPHSTAGQFLSPYPSGSPSLFIGADARLGHSRAIAGAAGNDEFGKRMLPALCECLRRRTSRGSHYSHRLCHLLCPRQPRVSLLSDSDSSGTSNRADSVYFFGRREVAC